jgi:hypothetical protein
VLPAAPRLNSASRQPQANRSAAHPAADDIGGLFGAAANHPSMRDIAPVTGKQNLPPKTLEMPVPPSYFAFRDRN